MSPPTNPSVPPPPPPLPTLRSISTLSLPGPASASPGLSDRLDTLLTQYLTLLDTYTTLRTQLSTEFSSGFLSLAHANRNATSTLGAGRRYGEEGFDGRMKATRGVGISISISISTPDVSTTPAESGDHETQTSPEETPKRKLTDDSHVSTQPDELKPSEPDLEPIKLKHHSFSSIPLQPTTTTTTNPLHWYGLLIPPPLRQCQSTFTTTTTHTIPSLLTTTSQMLAFEDEIWRVRKQLALTDDGHDYDYDYDYDHAHPGASIAVEDSDEGRDEAKEEGEEEDTKRAKKLTTKSSGNDKDRPSPQTKNNGLSNLVSRSRPSEPPRTRILKLD